MIKVGHRTGMDRGEAIDLAARSLWEAADADSATGGPDALRGIYPVVATVTAEGWEQVDDDELATRFEAIASAVRARSDIVDPTPPVDDGDRRPDEAGA